VKNSYHQADCWIRMGRDWNSNSGASRVSHYDVIIPTNPEGWLQERTGGRPLPM